MKKHLAVVATIGAGKTTVSRYFEDKGFELYKLSYAIYDEADRRGLDREDRIVLQDLGDEMRKKGGVEVLARIAVEKFQAAPDERFVIDSIRNHNEVLKLKEALSEGLLVLSIDAPLEIRYERVVARQGQYKEQDTTFEEFKAINDRDLGKENKDNEQNVQRCLDLSDIQISNDGTLEELENKVEELYEKYFK